jgi:lipopolysaccharide transport system ATP-binding protein
MTSTSLVRLCDIGKSYPLMASAAQQFGTLSALLRGKSAPRVFHALRGISFDVLPGQSLGLIGENGAGKSTLLKVIAGVVKPSSGEIEVRGRVGALLELGAGFHPDYSGRENIFLAAALMGLSRQQTAERLDYILAFADIGDHIEQPIKHYSSGMIVRLGFAIATAMKPDLLLTDEVLAVGDESFQKKCINWMENFLSDGGTMLVCSHSMYHIQKLCQRAAWIHHGEMRSYGAATDVTREYLTYHEEKSRLERLSIQSTPASGICQVRSVELNGVASSSQTGPRLGMGDELSVRGTIHSPDGRQPSLALGIVRADETAIYGLTNEMERETLEPLSADLYGFHLRFSALPLLPGRYRIQAHAMDPEGMRVYDCVEAVFDVSGATRELGTCRLDHVWLPY